MNPLLLLAVPVVLMIVGMILNSIGIPYDQTVRSSEQDAGKRLEDERESHRKLSDKHRTQFLKKQKRVGQFAWLALIGFLISFGWMYIDTVQKTTLSKQIATIHTVPTAEGKEIVMFVTLNDGNNVKYLIKAGKDGDGAMPVTAFSTTPLTSWELSGVGTALSVGNNPLPLGLVLRVSNGQ